VSEVIVKSASEAKDIIVLINGNGDPYCYCCDSDTCRCAKAVKEKYGESRWAVYIVQEPSPWK
jgi:hypothetical protein